MISTTNHGDAAPDLIRFAMSPDLPGRERLRAILRTHLACESAQTLRRFLVHVLAGLGGLVVLCVALPGTVSAETHRSLLAVWAVCLMVAVATAILEWRFRRREARLLAESDLDGGAAPAERR